MLVMNNNDFLYLRINKQFKQYLQSTHNKKLSKTIRLLLYQHFLNLTKEQALKLDAVSGDFNAER